MAIYRTVSLTFWTDSKVDDDFTPEDKYFMLYLLTNPHTRISGCYEIGSRQFERETGYNNDTISRLIDRMENAHNVIRYCKETKEVLILNWNKYNWCGSSPKLLQAVRKEAETIKCVDFRDFVLNKIDNPDYVYPTKEKRNKKEKSETVTETVTVTETDVSIGYVKGINRVSEKQASEDFEYLWSLYPRKIGKKEALAAYKCAVKDGVTKEEVETGIKAYIAYINAQKVQDSYIKHGSTYFNGRCWSDTYEVTGVNNSGRYNEFGGISNPNADYRHLDKNII